ncbi:MAG: crossover junction endodeoxyribonuclease RuvC [Chitinophagales bacterium]
MDKNKKIIGIDPGTVVLGYAVIEVMGKNEVKIHSLGVVRLNKYPDAYTKLKVIYEKISFLVNAYEPEEMAIEAPFFGKNVQSMLKLGRAQGVAIAAAMVYGMNVQEYAPRKIKQSITGNGNASKEQLSAMLKSLLKLETMPKYFDATDALGVAVCHHLQLQSPIPSGGNKAANWKAFLAANPDKVKKK